MTHCKQFHCGIFQLKFESPVVVSLILTLYSDQKDIYFCVRERTHSYTPYCNL